MKTCSKCGMELAEDKFSKDKSRKDGLTARCKGCDNQYYQDNKVALNKKQKLYYQDNKAACAEYSSQYRQDNKAAFSEYNKQHYQDSKVTYAEKGK